jgi:hypothetical protein
MGLRKRTNRKGRLTLREIQNSHVDFRTSLKYRRSAVYVQICFVDGSVEKRWFPISEIGRTREDQNTSTAKYSVFFLNGIT